MEAGRVQGEQPLGADRRWRSSGIEQPGISFHPEAQRRNPEFQCSGHKLKPSSLNASIPFRSCRTPIAELINEILSLKEVSRNCRKTFVLNRGQEANSG